jgi:alpha-1,6-mannosyltransferase
LTNLLKLSGKTKLFIILLSASLIELLLVIFNIRNNGGNIPLYIFIYFEIFLLFSLSFFIIKNHLLQDDNHKIFSISLPVFIIITGILFRVTLIPSVPTTSPDVFRYIWEGKVTAHGINPYQTPPDARILTQFRTDPWQKVGFKSMTSIYPPLAQVSFLIGYLLSGDSVWGLKIIYLICEIFTLIFLLKLLRLKNINPSYIILYAWLPIPVMEYFINAHIDVVGITFFILFIYHIEKGRNNLSAVFLALSFLVKFYPLMIFPLLIKKIGIKKLVPFTSIFLFTTFIFYIPFLTGDFAIKNSLTTYLLHWEFNGSVYNLIKVFSDGVQARIVCSILLVISIGLISYKYIDFLRGTFGVMLSFVIFATTIYPWYLGWIAALNPFLAFYSVLSLLLTSNFSNFTPMGRVWQEYWQVLIIEYIPFFLLLYLDLRNRFLPKDSNLSSF